MTGGASAGGTGGILVLVTGPPGVGKSTVAEVVAGHLDAAVLAHDWAMSGLRPYPALEAVLEKMEPSGHRVVGWSILVALARCQLRGRRPVVLDGVARADEVEVCRGVAREEGARFVVVAVRCSDRDLHRARVEDRRRSIPGWYELDWAHVERSLASFDEPTDADLRIDTAREWGENAGALADAFSAARS